MSSLKANVLVSYISQVYLILISLAILPIYIKYMGPEAYGLVGFFSMLQVFFNLLDFGLTPTISRQAALCNAGVESALKFRQLFRSLSIIFIVISCVGGIIIYYYDNLIVEYWLKVENLPIIDVLFCVQIMAICIAMRWITGLYRGVISGFERIVWLSVTNIFIATLKFPGVVLYMHYFGFTIKAFFIFQLYVAIIEFILLFGKCYKLLPKIRNNKKIGWSLKPVKPFLGFALTIAFTSTIWVLITQIDKLILSGILNLSEYGYYILAVMVAGGILQISAPISTAIMPRMARLYGENKNDELLKVYLASTQFVSVIVVTAGMVLTFLAKPILYVWTGDIELSARVAPILQLYALGNTLLTLGAFPYYLQYAKGDLKLHFVGNVIMFIMLVPLIIYSAKEYGAIGAGWSWLIIQLLYLLIWVTIVHRRVEPNINLKWFMMFLPNIFVCSALMFFTVRSVFEVLDNRIYIFFLVFIIGGLSLVISLLISLKFNQWSKNKNF